MKIWIYVTQDSLKLWLVAFSSFKRIDYSKSVCTFFPGKHGANKSVKTNNALGKASSQKCWSLYLEQDSLLCPFNFWRRCRQCPALHGPAARRACQPACRATSELPTGTHTGFSTLTAWNMLLLMLQLLTNSFCSNRSCTFNTLRFFLS